VNWTIEKMAISEFEIKRIEKYVGAFIEKERPPAHIRPKLDLGFRISNQSFEIFEIRPRFDNPNEKQEISVAKATYVKTKKIWKLYWMRADLKWHSYKPFPQARSVEEILETIKNDEHHCFWG
jgi:hypothetical protein